jgi:hypothetical protein
MTKRLVILLAPLLLAGPIDPRTPPTPPPPSDVHVDRHVDAHVPARVGEPATSGSETRSNDVGPDPAPGTGVFQSTPPPPAIQDPRDPLYRDRRY